MILPPELDGPGGGTRGRVGPDVRPFDEVARNGRYEEYCRQQVSLLLEIIPREAVRPLYRSARIWATERGLHESKDPMATLRVFCREVLPLPTFDVWLLDYEHHQAAHLGVGAACPPPREPSQPVAVEFKRIHYEAERWQGTLEVYRRGDVWRGLIRFHREGEPEGEEESYLRTGEIFREDDLQDLRNRFISFTAPTLSAFLRSTLP